MSNKVVANILADQRLARLKGLIPRSIKRFLVLHLFGADMGPGAHPSRKWLEQDVLPILPKLGFKRILFAGTAPYTWHYEAIVRRAEGEWITCDINQSAAIWGARRHVVAGVEELDRWFSAGYFDAVIINGILGFGINTDAELQAALCVVYRMLRPEGLLLLGWNSDATSDPLLAGCMRRLFGPLSAPPLPTRRAFELEAFVYDFQTCLGALC